MTPPFTVDHSLLGRIVDFPACPDRRVGKGKALVVAEATSSIEGQMPWQTKPEPCKASLVIWSAVGHVWHVTDRAQLAGRIYARMEHDG